MGLPVGFGCMRLSTEAGRDEARSLATLEAAVDAGARLLDTAPSYGLDASDRHHNERLVARVVAARPGAGIAVSTKGGLFREGTAWIPDGRAKAIRASCEASLEALGGVPIDLFLLHAVDPRTAIATSARALGDLLRQGLVRRVGLCNVNVSQIREAREHAPIAAVQVALSPRDVTAVRGGVVRTCAELGIEVHAHSPFGGPKRAARLARDALLKRLAEKYGTTPFGVVVAWLRGLGVVPLPGTRSPERAVEAVRAASITLEPGDHERLAAHFSASVGPAPQTVPARDGEVVLVMGIQAAGKSELVAGWALGGYQRLNRDTLGGTLRGVAQRLDEMAKAGATRFVLDNTYVSRASRAEVVAKAAKHGLSVRCVFVDTPIEQAQINAVERLCQKYGRVPGPDELRALLRSDPQVFAPTAQLRMKRDLEPPAADEGFAAIERVTFTRRERAAAAHAALVIEHRALLGSAPGELGAQVRSHGASRILVFAWDEGGSVERMRAKVAVTPAAAEIGAFDVLVCPHAGGPPVCWCRPPLPGLLVPWLATNDVDVARSILVGTHPAHDAMARALGMTATRLR